MTRKSTLWLLAGLVLSLSSSAAETRYNPFAGDAARTAPAEAGAADPSAGTAPPVAANPPMSLKAVIPGGRPPMANIDGRILVVGETFNGYTLEAVAEQGVTLRRGGRRLELRFDYGPEKTGAGSGTSPPGAALPVTIPPPGRASP